MEKNDDPKVLIVDDEPAMVRVLSRLLDAKGCLTRGAGSAEEALALAGKERFDLILIDIALPGITGLKAIEGLQDVSDAAILVMTGYADDELRKDALLLGAAGLLQKPFNCAQVLPLLRGSAS